MSATDIAKEVVRIVNTHGLAKDVIDLLEKKLALLVEENATLSTKVSRLEIENAQLRTQLKNEQPSMGVLWKRTDTGVEPIGLRLFPSLHIVRGWPAAPELGRWATCRSADKRQGIS